jgi:hypothetical protein
MPSSCWSQSSILSIPVLRRIRRWEVVGIRQNIERRTREAISYVTMNQYLAPSSSSQPKLPDHRNIPPDRHLATLAAQTKGGVRLSLLGLHVRSWALDRREPAREKAVTLCSYTEKGDA